MRDSGCGAFAEECATVGMTVGGSKGVVADPNIVPLIDVLLVLMARAIDIMRGAGIEHVGLITAQDDMRKTL